MNKGYLCIFLTTSQWLYCKGRWPNKKIYLAGVIIFENCNKPGIIVPISWKFFLLHSVMNCTVRG